MHPTLLFDRSDRARIEISGAHAVATLNGLVTSDVAALKPGQGQYAAALTAKGKIVADLNILMLDDRMLVDTSPLAAPGLSAMLSKYVNPRFATLTDITELTSTLTVIGQSAADVVSRVTSVPIDTLTSLASYGHMRGVVDSIEVIVLRLPPIGVDQLPCYDIIMPREATPRAVAALHMRGVTAGDEMELEMLRVESGFPQWGVDMDDNTLPQEANLDELHAVSYTKGCYIGQETVARIHFRGHVNRTLRRLEFAGDREPARSAVLLDSEQRNVGDVRSSVVSSRIGTIGIGMVRREVEDGQTLGVRWTDGATEATVVGKARGAIV